jgi:hypothetical protein
MVFIKNLLSSNDINFIKFGILNIRKQLTLEVNAPFLEIMKQGMMPILLNILDIYISHDTIVVNNLLIFMNSTKYFGVSLI